MSAYRHGVLIHNFNEDRFGIDLQSKKKIPDQPMKSISHIAHSWKAPVTEDYASDPPQGSECIARHLLFGHCGDMSDPRTNLMKHEFATAHKYFMQNPARVALHSLGADKFTLSEDPLKVGGKSVITDRIKANWGACRRSHSIPVGEMYRSASSIGFSMPEKDASSKSERFPRPYRDFTGGYDAVKLVRTGARFG
eukprot:gnl/MRDRNA2_/MRDRNA2_87610_c0_seq1.p1 gnl/MRDRNA2_/MRDRNA2_87610_c0~~gnl/MRDRNA2_/MRDRNA2_87610_c0_seq1.p1  ORF type:complete len:227 (-),score=39.89 gnl/MRDRNA2_/MRDRNA2_87610_c0_seq1:209-793(-)